MLKIPVGCHLFCQGAFCSIEGVDWCDKNRRKFRGCMECQGIDIINKKGIIAGRIINSEAHIFPPIYDLKETVNCSIKDCRNQLNKKTNKTGLCNFHYQLNYQKALKKKRVLEHYDSRSGLE